MDRLVNNKKNYKKKAFTLAEVLLTLAITGVIAAMTLPGLISNIQDITFKQQYKAMFSILSNANRMALNDNISFISSPSSGVVTTAWVLKNYLNLTKTCVAADKCWTQDTVYGLNGVSINSVDPILSLARTSGAYILQNGAVISTRNTNYEFDNYIGLYIYVDLNGLQKPNIVGKDIHRFLFVTPIGSFDTRLKPAYANYYTDETINYDATTINNGCLGFNNNDVDNYGLTCGAKWITSN